MSRLSKLISIFAVTGVLVLAQNGNVSAAPDPDPCFGGDCMLIDVFPGNDSVGDLFDDAGLVVMLIGTVVPAGFVGGVDVTRDDAHMGSWFSPEKAIDYMAVKAGPQYALYDYTESVIGDPNLSGFWTTNDLVVGQNGNEPDISHVSFYMSADGNGGNGGPPTAVIPEPATLLLLGSGVVGMGTMARRRSRRK